MNQPVDRLRPDQASCKIYFLGFQVAALIAREPVRQSVAFCPPRRRPGVISRALTWR